MRISGWAVFLFALLAAATGRAAEVSFPAPDMAVNEFSTTTYLDLARHFIPDIKPGDGGYVGTRRIPLRHVGGRDYDGAVADSYGFYDISAVRMQTDRKDRLLVLFDFAQTTREAQGLAVLALYDISRKPTLLDAVDIGFDQSTYLFDQGLMPVAPGTDVILTMSSHFNSSQTYTTHSMIIARGDRLTLIDSAFLFNEKLCATDLQQSIRYTANPDSAGPGKPRPYAAINVLVSEVSTPTGETCAGASAPPALKGDIKVTYTWDVASNAYVRDSDALDDLAKANAERF